MEMDLNIVNNQCPAGLPPYSDDSEKAMMIKTRVTCKSMIS